MHISVTKRMPALTKKEMRLTTSGKSSARDLAAHLVEDGAGGGEREGELLLRRRPGLLQVVGADVHRVPLRDGAVAVLGDVGDQLQRRRRGEDVGAARQVFLDDVVLDGALQLRDVGALLFGGGDVERQQPGGGGVDRHRGVHRLERDAVEERAHVAEVADRHADLADLAAGERVVAVVAGLGRQVEGDREAGLAAGEIAAVERVRGGGGGMAGIGAEQPGLVASDLGHALARNHGSGCDRKGKPFCSAAQTGETLLREDRSKPNIISSAGGQRDAQNRLRGWLDNVNHHFRSLFAIKLRGGPPGCRASVERSPDGTPGRTRAAAAL